jgi:hypothetical protein
MNSQETASPQMGEGKDYIYVVFYGLKNRKDQCEEKKLMAPFRSCRQCKYNRRKIE